MVNSKAIKRDEILQQEKGIKGYIYMLKNDVDDKIYVGSTKYSPDLRLSVHKAYSKTHHNKLYNHMNNVGCDNFKVITLETVKTENDKQLKEIECEYILKHKTIENGLNTNLPNCVKPINTADKKEYMKEYMKQYWKTQRGKEYKKETREQHNEATRRYYQKKKLMELIPA